MSVNVPPQRFYQDCCHHGLSMSTCTTTCFYALVRRSDKVEQNYTKLLYACVFVIAGLPFANSRSENFVNAEREKNYAKGWQSFLIVFLKLQVTEWQRNCDFDCDDKMDLGDRARWSPGIPTFYSRSQNNASFIGRILLILTRFDPPPSFPVQYFFSGDAW